MKMDSPFIPKYKSKYECPLDGAFLWLDGETGVGNDAYICSCCGTIYPTLSKSEVGVLKDIESQALSKLKKYENRLEEIQKEEKDIAKIFEFTKKSGLLGKLSKANLSANSTYINDLKNKIPPGQASPL